MRKLRIYLDTSVIGGCCDEKFATASNRVIEMVKRGKVLLLISTLLGDELEQAPPNVKSVLDVLPRQYVEFVMTKFSASTRSTCAKVIQP